MSAAKPLHARVGAQIRAYRKQRGLRQDDVAGRAREFGLTDWKKSTIAQLEAGTRRLTLEEFVLLASATGMHPVQDLLGGEGPVALGEKNAELDDVRRLFAEKEAAASGTGTLTVGKSLQAVWNVYAGSPELAAGGAAEQYAARKLGVEPLEVSAAAFRLWGRSLTEERDARVADTAPQASPRSFQALRGHITRKLMQNIQGSLAESFLAFQESVTARVEKKGRKKR